MEASGAHRVSAFAGPAPAVERTDEELASRARTRGADSLSSYGELVERYEGRIVSFLARRCGSRHEAEDLAQESFVRAWQRIGTYDPSRRFSVWLFTVAARVAASEWRKAKGSREWKSGKWKVESRNEEPCHERSDVWLIAERVLDPETVSALWLRYAAGLEPGEIGLVLGRTGVGVRVMLHRARKKLANHLER